MSPYRNHEDPYEHFGQSGIRRTLGAGWAKIHDGCGGLVRFVEAWNRPAVGWTGECLHCGSENIPEEHVVFVTDPAVPEEIGDVTELVDEDVSDLSALEYPMDVQERDGFAAAQDALREQIQEVTGR